MPYFENSDTSNNSSEAGSPSHQNLDQVEGVVEEGNEQELEEEPQEVEEENQESRKEEVKVKNKEKGKNRRGGTPSLRILEVGEVGKKKKEKEEPTKDAKQVAKERKEKEKLKKEQESKKRAREEYMVNEGLKRKYNRLNCDLYSKIACLSNAVIELQSLQQEIKK